MVRTTQNWLLEQIIRFRDCLWFLLPMSFWYKQSRNQLISSGEDTVCHGGNFCVYWSFKHGVACFLSHCSLCANIVLPRDMDLDL